MPGALQYWSAFPVVTLGCTLTIIGGVGGNLLCGPFFILVLRLPPHVAIATALVTEVFSMGSGVAGYAWRRLIDYRLAASLAAAAAPMAMVGAWLSVRAPAALLRALFGAGILLIAGLLLRSDDSPTTGEGASGTPPGAKSRVLIDSSGRTYRYDLRGRVPLVAGSMVAGLGSGLIGIGGGELNTPAMAISGVPIRVAAATAVAIMAVTVLVGALAHVAFGEPLWPLTVWTIPGALLGGQLGSLIASRTPAHRLRRWLSWLFVAVGTTMLARAW
jgi:uncharacterized membrane protein YfcA